MAGIEVEFINGKEFKTDELREMICNVKSPVVLTNMLDEWVASTWSMDEFTKLFGAVRTRFKLYRKPKKSLNLKHKPKKLKLDVAKSVPVQETDCIYKEGCFTDFRDWLVGKTNEKNLLHNYPRCDYWCYADYNHMPLLFKDHDDVSLMNCVDWSIFGFPARNGVQSTIWVGSEGSFTPCHQDTYGFNLVAQIHGTKKWLLIPPEQTNLMSPVRIPYEESSVFSRLSEVEIENIPGCLKIELDAKQVLVVPKHWWHYVESVTPSITINSWIEMESDKDDRIHEAITQTLVYALGKTGGNDDHWLNPGQEIPDSLEDCLHTVQSTIDEKLGVVDHQKHSRNITPEMLVNCLCEKETLDKLVESLTNCMLQGNDNMNNVENSKHF